MRLVPPSALLIGLVACSSGPSDLASSPSETIRLPDLPESGVELSFGQVAELDSEGLRVRFVSLGEDSRCPSDVVCVWEGRVVIGLEVEAGARSETVQLTLGGAAGPGTVDGSAEGEAGGYRFTLLQVTPYPHSATPAEPEDYVVRILIGRVSDPANSQG